MNAKLFWAVGAEAFCTDTDSTNLPASVASAIATGANRVDATGGGTRAAAIVTSPPGTVVEFFDGDDRFILRPRTRELTACCFVEDPMVAGTSPALSVEDATSAMIEWLNGANLALRTDGILVRASQPMTADIDRDRRRRVFDTVARYRRLRGRRLTKQSELVDFLVAAISVAGAARLPLSDVVRLADATGDLRAATDRFATAIDDIHALAHNSGHDIDHGSVDAALESVSATGCGQLRRLLHRYLACVSDPSRVAASG